MARDPENINIRTRRLEAQLKEVQDKLTIAKISGSSDEIERLSKAIKRITDRIIDFRDQVRNMEAQNRAEADHLYTKLIERIKLRKDELKTIKNSTSITAEQAREVQKSINKENRLRREATNIIHDQTISQYETAKLLRNLLQTDRERSAELTEQANMLKDAIRDEKARLSLLERQNRQRQLAAFRKFKESKSQSKNIITSVVNTLGPELGGAINTSIFKLFPRIGVNLVNTLSKVLQNKSKRLSLEIGTALFTEGIKRAMERQDMFKGIQRSVGMTNKQLYNTRDTLEGIAFGNFKWYTTSKNVNESYMELSDIYGSILANSEQLIVTQSKLKAVYGLTSDEANDLQKSSTLSNKTGEEILTNTVSLVHQYSKATGFGFKQAEVLKAVNKQSSAIRSMFKNNVELLSVGVMKAKLLGTTLEQVSGVMGGMLNLENSITSEIEAGVLLNKELNLDAMRMYSLRGDQLGVMRELQKNLPDMKSFDNLDMIQKEGLAKALQMDVNALSDMVRQAEFLQKLNITQYSTFDKLNAAKQDEVRLLAEQGDAAAKKLMQDAEQATASERLEKSVDQLATAMRKLSKIMIGVGAALIGFALGGGVGAAIGAAVGGIAAYNMDDGAINPNGGLIVSKPKGGIIAQVDKSDNIVATTNPINSSSATESSHVSINLNRVERLLEVLIQKVSQPVYINLNGNVIRELETQQSLIRSYNAGMGNSYGTLNKTF